MPNVLNSVSSLLLFNTGENPYKEYISIDNLAGKEFQKREERKGTVLNATVLLLLSIIVRATPYYALLNHIDNLADAPTTLGSGRGPGLVRKKTLSCFLCLKKHVDNFDHCLFMCQPQVSAIDYSYTPIPGEVPVFNLPSVLPDLPMVTNIFTSAS